MLLELQSRITNLLHTYYTILGLQTTDLNNQLLNELNHIFNLITEMESINDIKINNNDIKNIVLSDYIYSDSEDCFSDLSDNSNFL